MINKIFNAIRYYNNRILKRVLGETKYTKLMFKKKHGYKLNLDKPKTFSEKIQWYKFFGNIELLAPFIDKYEVRSFVKKELENNI